MSAPNPAMSREEKLALLARLAREKANQPKKAPLSFAQERHYFLTRLEPDSFAHSIFRAYTLTGPFDPAAWQEAMRDVLRRHESLRATFLEEDGNLVQLIAPASLADTWLLTIDDLRGEKDPENKAENLALEAARRPFELGRELPFRCGLLHLGENSWVLLLTLHHIVADGWSLGILLRELWGAYGSRRRGEAPNFEPLPISFSDFANWQHDKLDLAAQIAFWKKNLENAPITLDLATDFPRPALARLEGDYIFLNFSPELTTKARQLARSQGATPFITLLAVFSILLHRVTGQNDLLIGSPIANRNRKEIEGLIGSFANTVVLRSTYDGSRSFLEHLRHVRQASLAAFDHQDLPFERLVDELQPPRDLSRNPLFQVMFALLEGSASGAAPASPAAELEIEPFGIPRRLSKVDLTLELIDHGDHFGGYFEFATSLFEKETILQLALALESLLQTVLHAPATRLDRLPLLPEECQQVLANWNATDARTDEIEIPVLFDFLHEARYHPGRLALVEAVAQRAGTSSAEKARRLTYAELEAATARLAAELVARGVRRGDRVGLCLERSLEAMVAFLAVWRAGAAYVALDPGHPQERLAYLIEDSGIGLLLTRGELAGRLPASDHVAVLPLDDLLAADQPAPAFADLPLTGDDLAYVIYTSGSTGRPKGVLVPHRGLKNHALAIARLYELSADDRVLQFASLSFDLAGEEIYPTLLQGGTLVLRPEAQSLALADFRAFLATEGITVANLPTPYWHEWARELGEGRETPPPALRLVIVGTEQALPERLADWRRAVGERPRWVNSYGPSETTITATSWDAPAGEAPRRIAIGRPIANTRAYVLDREGEPLPIGQPGELALAGAGLAHGYLGRPALTAEKFRPDPFSPVPGGRLYLTGDRVRFLPDGNLEFLGRFDFQVKVRGYRIEVGEIEAWLTAHDAVADAVVLAREVGPGDRRLVAYVARAAAAGHSPGDNQLEAALRTFLEARLPSYMVPSTFVFLDQLPLSRSGKVNREALAQLPIGALPGDEQGPTYAAPRDPVEEVLVEVWSSLLGPAAGGRSIGIHDDFFALGGHSLLATRLLSRLRTLLGVELPLKDVFEAPTLEGLARRIHAARAAGRPQAGPIQKLPADHERPLSFAQQRMWFLAQLDPESPAYNMPNALRIEGQLDVALLERCLSEIVRRHETLRTTFRAERGQPIAVVHPPEPWVLEITEAADETEAHTKAAALSLRPFALESEKPLRLELIRIGEQLHWLALVFHHVASDGWSTDLFLHELEVLYRAFGAGRPSPLPELPIAYSDYAAWQTGALSAEVMAAELEFWKEKLAGVPTVLELPTDRPRPAVRRYRGGRVRFEIGDEPGLALRELGRSKGCSLYMTFLAAYAAFLSRISHQDDIVVGTPIAGRSRPEVEKLIGFFANTLVLRLRLKSGISFEEMLGMSRNLVLDAYDHQDLPFEKLVDEVAPQRASSFNSLFQVTFVLHHQSPFHADELGELGGERGPELRFSLPSVDNHTARFDLALSLVEKGNGFRAFLEYDADLFDPATVERYSRCFLTFLRSIAAGPKRRIADLEILPADELARILSPWPGLHYVDSNAQPTITEMFLRAAKRFPDRPALTCEGVTLTYTQLERKSAALARALVARGVGYESRVGLAIDRSLELILGILGILRANAAYVPIDPASPTDRMAFILEDSGSELLLSRQGVELPPSKTPRLDIDLIDLDTEGEAPTALITGQNLAYVIYTSGSTGKPKGVACTHGNAVRLFSATEPWYQFSENDVWTLFHSSAFDFSVWEMWGALFYGGRLVVVTYFVTRSVEIYYELLKNEGVTFLNTTPSMFRQIDRVDEEETLKRGESPLKTLRVVIFGGEAVDLQGLAGWWRRHGGEKPRLVNAYGITETTVAGAYRPLDPTVLDMSVASVIGQPFPDLEYYFGDREMNLVPIGVKGEILVGGAGITRGYLGRPSLTAQRFVPNPFAKTPGERLYHSGDLGRLVETHLGLEMDYHGRIDLQVKIRGFRIELGEIETSLTELDTIHEAIVLAREDEPGDKRLVGYVTLTREAREAHDAGLGKNELIQRWRSQLAGRLPDYMIPVSFVILGAFPLTVNGKVDRKVLPPPEKDRSAVAANFIEPRNEVEAKVVAIWQEVLGHEKIGAEDDFFELGGHSLLATKVLARLRESFDVELPLRLLFEKKTVAALAEEIVSRGVAEGVENADEDLLRRLLEEL